MQPYWTGEAAPWVECKSMLRFIDEEGKGEEWVKIIGREMCRIDEQYATTERAEQMMGVL